MITPSHNPADPYFVPTREWIDSLKPGDLAPNVYGDLAPITTISAVGDDVQGRRYVCLYTRLSDTSRISGSFKEGELHRTFSAHEITAELRQASPSLEIAHDRVRDAVHAAMRLPVGAGVYAAQHGAYVVYRPVAAYSATPAPPAAPGPSQRVTGAPAATPASGDTAQLSGLPLLPIPGQGA